MSINIQETLSQGLSLLTYNGNSILPSKDNQLNIFMGIGLCSVRDGLSEGLPEYCIKKSNAIATIYNMLNHWANLPKLSSKIVIVHDESASPLLSDFLSDYDPTCVALIKI
mgnify:CR=1 FL=1